MKDMNVKFKLNASWGTLGETTVLGYFTPRYCGVKVAKKYVYDDPRVLGLATSVFFNADKIRFEEYGGYVFLLANRSGNRGKISIEPVSTVLRRMVDDIIYNANLYTDDWDHSAFADVVDEKNFLHHICYLRLRGIQNKGITVEYLENEFGLHDLFSRAYVGAYKQAMTIPSAKEIFSIWEDLKVWKRMVG